jgi:hypothetical protein
MPEPRDRFLFTEEHDELLVEVEEDPWGHFWLFVGFPDETTVRTRFSSLPEAFMHLGIVLEAWHDVFAA